MKTAFTTVRTEGGILPADLLTKVLQRDATIGGVTEESYHVTGEKLNEAISRSWNRLLGVWRGFQEAAAKLPANDFGTTVTREKWLLPLFEALHYGRLKQRTFELEGATVPISHGWENVPIHLTGFRISIDKRTPGAAGAAKKSPHSLLQEFLNRSAEHAWGIVSNGETLRLLRDNVALTRQAFVEFDLMAMMEGEVYADFALLWMLCHQSRLDASKPEEFWLERWSKVAQDQGIRALDQLRNGVAKAIEALGAGFLGHRDNQGLRDALAAGELDKQEYYRQLLRIVYRMLFLFVAEDRDLLLDPEGSTEAKDRYRSFYSTQRLRQVASSRRGSRHRDLYEQLRFVFRSLDAEEGCVALALKPLGSFLFSGEATAALDRLALANSDLLAAVRHLSVLRDGKVTRVVDFRNLRSEELGSVYEALLEMHPEAHLETGAFELKTAAGNERKTTGSYYTPESLVQLLLDSALDPVLAEAAAKPDAERAILDLNVCDPACGSGHFLIAAAHRIAKKLASARTGDEEADPVTVRKSLRDVIGHCIHGVDINPMAVELCKVALWMEALEPGKPLSFLEQKIQRGNSLLGASPELLAKGIPDEALDPIEGDDKDICKRAKAQNRRYRETQQATFDFSEPWQRLGDLATGLMQLELSSDDTLVDVRRKEKRWKEIVESTDYLFGQLWADSWCAAFVWKKTNDNLSPIEEETFRKLERNPYAVDVSVRHAIRGLAEEFGFFHWHLRFPEIFGYQESGSLKARRGFDCVIGNPPWDVLAPEEHEFFAAAAPEIVKLSNRSARQRALDKLKTQMPLLHKAWIESRRRTLAEAAYCHRSGAFPLTGSGNLNTFSLFFERALSALQAGGRLGLVVPSSLAFGDATKELFTHIVRSQALVSFLDFENRRRLFVDIDSRTRFALVTVAGPGRAPLSRFAFLLHGVDDVNAGDRVYTLTAAEMSLLNPNTNTAPTFRSRVDRDLVIAIHKRMPILRDSDDKSGWHADATRMVDMSYDSDNFITADDQRAEPPEHSVLPLYEAKMIGQFNHRGADVTVSDTAKIRTGQKGVLTDEDLAEPGRLAKPRFWMRRSDAFRSVPAWYNKKYFAVFTRVTSPTNSRTTIAAVVPEVAVGHSLGVIYVPGCSGREVASLVACLNSFVVDYVCREKIGGINLNPTVVHQLPVLARSRLNARAPFTNEKLVDWVAARVLELSYTAFDLRDFATDCGYAGPPFRWDSERRTILLAELDAAFFVLYELSRSEIIHVLNSFVSIKKTEEDGFGVYRTRDLIVGIYDRMRQAMDTGGDFYTTLKPSSADPRAAHTASR